MNCIALPFLGARPASASALRRGRAVVLCLGLALGGAAAAPGQTATMDHATPANAKDTAVLGGGCFWCTDAVFRMLPGVTSVTAGYAGGTMPNPTYKDVCSGLTGHAEVIQIEFDAKVVSYEKLLETFWQAHDPTTLNWQGPDHGTQYRSIILYRNAAQKAAAEKSKAQAQTHFASPIVTEIVPLTHFYKAEGYHQDFYRRNPAYPYCRVIIQPKVDKMEKKLQGQAH